MTATIINDQDKKLFINALYYKSRKVVSILLLLKDFTIKKYIFTANTLNECERPNNGLAVFFLIFTATNYKTHLQHTASDKISNHA